MAYDGSLASSGGTGVCEYMYVPVESRFLNTVLVDGRFLTGDIRVPSYIDVPTPSSKNIWFIYVFYAPCVFKITNFKNFHNRLIGGMEKIWWASDFSPSISARSYQVAPSSLDNNSHYLGFVVYPCQHFHANVPKLLGFSLIFLKSKMIS